MYIWTGERAGLARMILKRRASLGTTLDRTVQHVVEIQRQRPGMLTVGRNTDHQGTVKISHRDSHVG